MPEIGDSGIVEGSSEGDPSVVRPAPPVTNESRGTRDSKVTSSIDWSAISEGGPLFFFGGAMLILAWALIHTSTGVGNLRIPLWGLALALGVIAVGGGTTAALAGGEGEEVSGFPDDDSYVRVSRDEWERLNEELLALKNGESPRGVPFMDLENPAVKLLGGGPTSQPNAPTTSAIPPDPVGSPLVEGPSGRIPGPRDGLRAEEGRTPSPSSGSGTHVEPVETSPPSKGLGISAIADTSISLNGQLPQPSPFQMPGSTVSRESAVDRVERAITSRHPEGSHTGQGRLESDEILAELSELERELARQAPHAVEEALQESPSVREFVSQDHKVKGQTPPPSEARRSEILGPGEGHLRAPPENRSARTPSIGGETPKSHPFSITRPRDGSPVVVWEAAVLRMAGLYGVRRLEGETAEEYLDRTEKEIQVPGLPPAREVDRLRALVDGIVYGYRHLPTSMTYQLVGLFRADLEELAEAIGLPKREYENPLEYAQRLREILSLVRIPP